MSTKKLITVFGATGAQGGSVVRFLLEDAEKSFAVRAVTRNPDSQKAKELTAKGVEVVKGDLNDIESIKAAVKGAYGVFGVTNYWDTMSLEGEVRQGKALVDAIVAADVKHYVWSTLIRTSDPAVDHTNSKAEVTDYLKTTNIPHTSIYTTSYYENHLYLPPFTFSKSETGEPLADWPLLLTDGPIGGYSVADTGAYVRVAFKDPAKWISKDIRIVSDVYTPREFVGIVSEVTGRKIQLVETTRERFVSAKPIMVELWNNMEAFYKLNGNIYGTCTDAEDLYPERKTIRTWIEANKDALVQSFS